MERMCVDIYIYFCYRTNFIQYTHVSKIYPTKEDEKERIKLEIVESFVGCCQETYFLLRWIFY